MFGQSASVPGARPNFVGFIPALDALDGGDLLWSAGPAVRTALGTGGRVPPLWDLPRVNGG